MAKYLRQINGIWNFVEEETLLGILSAAAGNLKVKEMPTESTPKFSLSGSFHNPRRLLGDRVVATNEYNSIYAEFSITSEDSTIWETKLWVFREQHSDVGLTDLAIEIIKTENPDAMLYFSISKTQSLISEIVQEANIIALNKRYNDVVPSKFQRTLKVTGLYRTVANQNKSPILVLEAEALKVDITVKIDFFADIIEISYHYNNALPRITSVEAYSTFPKLRQELLGKNGKSNTVLNSMRVHGFLEEQKNWNNPEFVEKILDTIDPIFLQNLK